MWRSVPQIDAAATSTSTSPGPGVGTGTSTSSRPGPGADLRSARMVDGRGSVTAEAYFPPRAAAHTRGNASAVGEAALRRLHPWGDPVAVGVVDRGSRRHDLIDRGERGVVEADVRARDGLVELVHRLGPDDDRGHRRVRQ